MDHWVCGIVHAFSQIWIVERSLSPGIRRRGAQFYVSGNCQSSSPLSGARILVKLLFHMGFSMLYFSKAWIAYSSESCWISSNALAFLITAAWCHMVTVEKQLADCKGLVREGLTGLSSWGRSRGYQSCAVHLYSECFYSPKWGSFINIGNI